MVVKYLRENIGQEICSKKGIYACLVAAKVVEIRRRILVALQLLDLPKHNNNERNTINNKNTTCAMHTHDDMTF